MEDDFYIRFENEYRGSREAIKDRLKVYLPIINPLIELYPNALAIDLGCGRGEWLDLLNESGWNPMGIDTNQAMVNFCKDKNLNVIKTDAVSHLNSCDSHSTALITGFHIIEHLQFQDQHDLIRETLRVLIPGGLLILETPNPENIKVATEDFYLDPTHIHPVPSKLLSFLAKDAGFYRNTIFRLQETQNNRNDQKIELMDVLAGVSPDYAVVAQKEAANEVLQRFDHEFERPHGILQEPLAKKYDLQFDEEYNNLLSNINIIKSDVKNLQSEVNSFGSENERLKEYLDLAQNSINNLLSENKILINERNKLIEDLNQIRASIQTLQSDLASKEIQIETYQSDLADKENQVKSLSSEIKRKTIANNTLSTELAEIKRSKSWKFAMFFRRIRYKLAPPESLPAKFIRKTKGCFESIITKLRRRWHYRKYKNFIKKSGLFERDWYLSRYPDVAEARIDPLKHYLFHGGFEGRDPSPKFSSSWYLNAYQDVKDAGLNPLIHYILFGQKEGRLANQNIKSDVEDSNNNPSSDQKYFYDLLNGV